MAIIITLVDAQDDIPIGLWAQEHCSSFTGWITVDMSENPTVDTLMDFRFYFNDERDALTFVMRWQGQYETSYE